MVEVQGRNAVVRESNTLIEGPNWCDDVVRTYVQSANLVANWPNTERRRLFSQSHMYTAPSHPPDAKVLYLLACVRPCLVDEWSARAQKCSGKGSDR